MNGFQLSYRAALTRIVRQWQERNDLARRGNPGDLDPKRLPAECRESFQAKSSYN